MSWTTAPPAGSYLRGSVLSALITDVRPINAVKTATTSRNTTAAHAADPHLVVTVPAGTWDFELTLHVTSAANAAGDFSWRLAWTGTGSAVISSHGLVDTLASGVSADLAAQALAADTATPTADLDVGCSTSITVVYARVRFVATTSCTVTLEWAQQTSNGNNTNLLIDSSMTAHKVA